VGLFQRDLAHDLVTHDLANEGTEAESKFFDAAQSRGRSAVPLACYKKVIVNGCRFSVAPLIYSSEESGPLEAAGFACGTAHRRVMCHQFILFSGYVLRPRGVAIRDRTILFEISFKFFFAHRGRLPLFTAQ
jgi:hypothetical protein